MSRYSIESSPKLYARVGGALYFAIIVLGFFAEGVRSRAIVSGNPAATAADLAAMEGWWRAGIAAEYIALVCATVLAMIYFVLLKPVSREINLLATFLRIVAIAVQAVAVVDLDGALSVLRSAAMVNAFTPDQLHALAVRAIGSHSHTWAVALLFFGACFLFHGYLIFRSGFLPRVLGVLIQIGGACYMTNSLAVFLSPALSDRIFPLILLPAFIGESSLCLWLLIKGVDEERWRAR